MSSLPALIPFAGEQSLYRWLKLPFLSRKLCRSWQLPSGTVVAPVVHRHSLTVRCSQMVQCTDSLSPLVEESQLCFTAAQLGHQLFDDTNFLWFASTAAICDHNRYHNQPCQSTDGFWLQCALSIMQCSVFLAQPSVAAVPPTTTTRH